MPTTILRSGLQITVPSDYKVSPGATTADSQRRSPITRPTGPVPLLTSTDDLSREHDAIIQALEQQEMQLFDSASVEPEPSEARRGVAGAGEPADKAELSMEVEPYESAVVLLEQDGFYSWTFPTETQAVVSGKNVRGARTSAPKRRLVFRIDVPSAKSPSAGPSRRGFVKDFVFARIRAFVFKFAAQVMVEHGMRFLERNVRKGIVRISAADPAQWSALQDLSSLQFAQNRPARILLFVHGTFSNTVGAFGALGSSPWGKAWLEAALANYDAILGFDHPTLSENPLENATDLLQELEKVSWAQPPHFDVVVHSRGALVFRSLVENLLPSSPWQAYFDRVVFVAGTNGGTQLAEPRNWQQMIDLYTNLAVAACRLIGMMPQAKAVALVLKESIQGIGAFLKYSATTAVTERKVPGLAAMEPDGEFVKDLNRSQPGRPTVATTYYCAITSSFVPQLTDGQPRPKELPVRLVSWILEVLAKEIMKQPNDLVVNTSAMTAIELEVGNFIKDKLDFGENPEVYHTNYFTRPEVVNALANWLNLAKPAPPAVREIKTSGRVRKSRGGGSGHIRIGGSKSEGGNKTKSHDPASGPVFAGTIYHNWIDAGGMALPPRAAALDTDFIVRDAADPIANVVAAIEKIAPSYVVLRRPWYGETLDYAFSAEEILAHPKAKTSMSLMDALDLHETDRSPNLSAFEPLLRPVRGGAPTSGRAVVLARDRPVGVLPDSVSLTNNIDLIDLARLTGSAKITDRIFTRRAMPTLLIAEPLDIPASKSKVGTFACHFHAEMDDEVVLKHVTTVEVLLSREVIERSIHAAAASSSAKVEADRKLIVQVIPRVNFETVDTSRIEVDPPAPDAPQTLMFDVRPTHTGKGEIWVVIRQGPVPLATLSLRPNIVETKARENRRTSSSADTAEAEKVPGPLHQLFITEQRNGDQVSYFYQLQSPDLGLLEWTNTKPFIGDRKKYVDGIYKEIEQRWLSSHSDVETFTQDLRAYGAQLLDELIPKELQVTLWEHRDQLKSIMVISTEPFIPWELVHLKDPAKGMPPDLRFLGQMGLVRWLHQAGWPPDVVKIRKGKVRYVVPDYPHPDYVLAEAAKEPLFLKKEFQATAVTPQPNDVRDLLQQPGAFDLLHFACHGFAESDNISNAQLMLQGRVEGGKYLPAYLSATTAAQFSNLKTTENRPMIVLNACQAARAGYTLTGVGGFAQAFINAGAGCFVSSLWSVGDQPARTFTETLYSELLRSRKLSDAAIEARKKAKNAGDATWLAYAVYGHPYMKVRRT